MAASVGTFNSYFEFHNKDAALPSKIYLNAQNILLNNVFINNYALLTGTNTGYGFYGVNVATEKFFIVELFNSSGEKIKTITTFNFKRISSLQRFNVLPSMMFNLISKNKEIYSKEIPEENKKYIMVLEKYINKIFKHVGLYAAQSDKNCSSYNVKLCAINVTDIWLDNNYTNNKSYLVYNEIKFNK